MGEDPTIAYGPVTTTATNFSNSSFTTIKPEDQTVSTNGVEMVPYTLPGNEAFCMGDEKSPLDAKMFADMTGPTYQSSTERHQLHHMPSISTTCTSDSFHSSLTSADSGELSAYDLNTSDSQDYDWSISQPTHFQWPPNRISLENVLTVR